MRRSNETGQRARAPRERKPHNDYDYKRPPEGDRQPDQQYWPPYEANPYRNDAEYGYGYGRVNYNPYSQSYNADEPYSGYQSEFYGPQREFQGGYGVDSQSSQSGFGFDYQGSQGGYGYRHHGNYGKGAHSYENFRDARFRGQYQNFSNRSDEEIRDSIYDALDEDWQIPGDADVDVKVENKVVALTGAARNRYTKESIGRCAWEEPGVRDVHNNISITSRRDRAAKMRGATGHDNDSAKTRQTGEQAEREGANRNKANRAEIR